MVSQPPRVAPCVRIASIAYEEHVGVKRHVAGVHGEIAT